MQQVLIAVIATLVVTAPIAWFLEIGRAHV